MFLFVIFVVAPIVELYVIVQASHAIGVWDTLGLLVLMAFLGSWVIKHEGLKVWNRFVQQLQAGQAPTREIADGVCVVIAGALLIAPGFVSDVVALLLLFPPTRAIFRRIVMRRRGLGGGGGRVIRATYGGRMPGGTTFTDTTSTETRGELDP
ncbi:MAG TPA: FxsA family protein [Ilumatobacteraceae bacterium]|jgi:UPF0716 protein FxsA